MRKLPFLYLLLLLAACGRPQTASKSDKNNSQKTPDEPTGYVQEVSFFCKARALSQGDNIVVFVNVELKKGFDNLSAEKFITRFSGSFAVLPDYGRKDYITTGSIFLTPETVKLLKPNVFSVSFRFAKSATLPAGVLILEISDLQTKQKAGDDLTVHFTDEKLTDRFAVFQPGSPAPFISNHYQTGDPFELRSLSADKQVFTVSHYADTFEPAASPLAAALKINPLRNMKVDSVFTLAANTPVTFSKPGLYFFTTDTLPSNGIALWMADTRFPRLTRPASLLKPLVYISSNDEIKENQTTPAAKKALDKYWLRLASGNEEAARKNIRLYYRRVALANQLFTTYKEGWKTDMGMVFTVMGPPSKINRLKDRQVWTYSDNPNFSEINFTFIKRPNAFAENNFELVRYAEYEPIWFPAVEHWRTGTVE